jgi:hypothetical protein
MRKEEKEGEREREREKVKRHPGKARNYGTIYEFLYGKT